MKKIITISREFGSGGRVIGEALAKELGFSFFEKEIIAQTAEKTGLSEKYIAERGEYSPKNNIFLTHLWEEMPREALWKTIYTRHREILFMILPKKEIA